jgi:hypothetical protein
LGTFQASNATLDPGRHANIDDHELGLLIADDAQELLGVACPTRDLEP